MSPGEAHLLLGDHSPLLQRRDLHRASQLGAAKGHGKGSEVSRRRGGRAVLGRGSASGSAPEGVSSSWRTRCRQSSRVCPWPLGETVLGEPSKVGAALLVKSLELGDISTVLSQCPDPPPPASVRPLTWMACSFQVAYAIAELKLVRRTPALAILLGDRSVCLEMLSLGPFHGHFPRSSHALRPDSGPQGAGRAPEPDRPGPDFGAPAAGPSRGLALATP